MLVKVDLSFNSTETTAIVDIFQKAVAEVNRSADILTCSNVVNQLL